MDSLTPRGGRLGGPRRPRKARLPLSPPYNFGAWPWPEGPRLGIPPFTMILQGKVEALHQMIRLEQGHWN